MNLGEGPVLNQCARIMIQGLAYPKLSPTEPIVFNYPPVYYLLTHAVAATGLDLLLAGRIVALISMLGVALVTGLLVYRVVPARLGRIPRFGGAALVVLSFGFRAVTRWAPIMRVDLPALLLTLAGMYCFVQRRMALAFVFFSLAMFTKHNFFSALAACLIVAAILGVSTLLRCLGAASAVALPLLAGYVWWTGGEFLNHLVRYNIAPFSLRLMIDGMWRNFLDIRWVLCFAAPAVALATVKVIRARSVARLRLGLRASRFRLALAAGALHWIFSLLISASYGKFGSDFNYFLEWDLVSCWLGGMIFSIVVWKAQRTPRKVLLAAPALLIPMAGLLEMAPVALRSFKPSSATLEEAARTREKYRELYRLVAAIPGPVISQDMTVVVQSGKKFQFEPDLIRHMTEVGSFDETPLIARVAAAEYGAIILYSSLDFIFTPRMAAAVRQNYEERQTIGQFRIYRPRGAP